MIYLKLKRIIDIIISLCAILFLLPLLLIIAILIKFESKGPVLFKQERIGKRKRHFQILKFRTMYIDTPNDVPTHMLSSSDKYITKVGKFLRKTSLDELPQLINIILGDMSIIGPRPALWNQYDLITERDKYNANEILPGLTGWAQINGRDELSIQNKANLDGEYLKKISLWFDMKIFFCTFLNVFRGKDIVEGGTDSLRINKTVLDQKETIGIK